MPLRATTLSLLREANMMSVRRLASADQARASDPLPLRSPVTPSHFSQRNHETLSGDQGSCGLIGICGGGVRRASVWSGAKEPFRSGLDVQMRGYLAWRGA